MKVTLNPDPEVVARVQEGLRRTAGTVPAGLPGQRRTNVFARNFGRRWPTPTLRGTATVCSTTSPWNDGKESLICPLP